MRIAGEPGKWTCAELSLTRSFGYGLYTFTLDDISTLDPAARFVIFTWDGPAVALHGREMAITIGRHGKRPEDNGRYIIEPVDVPANRSNFFAPAGVLTHQMRWGRSRHLPPSVARAGAAARRSRARVPAACRSRNETIRFSLYVLKAVQRPCKNGEVVVGRFTFVP